MVVHNTPYTVIPRDILENKNRDIISRPESSETSTAFDCCFTFVTNGCGAIIDLCPQLKYKKCWNL